MVALSGRSAPVSGRLAFLATTLNPICPGPLPRIFTLTMRTPSRPVVLRHVHAVGCATQPFPLASFKPGGTVTSISDEPAPLASRKRTPFSCGLSGGTIGAGMTAMPFTLSVSSSGGGRRRVTVRRGLKPSVAFTHGSTESQMPSASMSAHGNVVEVDVVVVLLVLDEVVLLDEVLLDVVIEVDVEVVVLDDELVVWLVEVDELVVLLVEVDELLLDVVLDVDVVVTLALVLVLDVVLVLVVELVVDEVLVLVVVVELVVDEVELVVLDDVLVVLLVEVDVVVVEDVLVLVVVPPALLIVIVSNTVPALSMPSSVITLAVMRTDVYW